MKKNLFSILVWGVIFLAALIGVDRWLMTTRVKLPVLTDVQHFYLDFRGRLSALVEGDDDPVSDVIAPPKNIVKSIQTVAEKVEKKISPEPSTLPGKDTLKYLYVDGQGQLNFTSSFSEIPAEFKKSAELLKD
ncbi:MAG: hypothetical protein K0A93_07695 [Desulfuromonadaceae bacterium]|nr:hypothetical protein [Desulfuromonadaceae bacterium]